MQSVENPTQKSKGLGFPWGLWKFKEEVGAAQASVTSGKVRQLTYLRIKNMALPTIKVQTSESFLHCIYHKVVKYFSFQNMLYKCQDYKTLILTPMSPQQNYNPGWKFHSERNEQATRCKGYYLG